MIEPTWHDISKKTAARMAAVFLTGMHGTVLSAVLIHAFVREFVGAVVHACDVKKIVE